MSVHFFEHTTSDVQHARGALSLEENVVMNPWLRNLRRPHTWAIGAALLLTSIAPAAAQVMQPPASPNDLAFVSDMLQQSREQLALAHLAQERTTNSKALAVADQVATEWAALRRRLIPIAFVDGAPVRGSLTPTQLDVLALVGRTPAWRFDQVYLRQVQRGDRVALERIAEESGTSNLRLEAFLNYARPLIASSEQSIAAVVE